MKRPSWDDTFLEIAAVLAKRSKDESTKIGCVIVGPGKEIRSVGYNCFPRGCDDNRPERQLRPEKYLWMTHAEVNAISNSARMGTPLLGCVCYIPALPCADCARALIQSGIKEIVVGSALIPERWRENCEAALAMLEEAGVLTRLANSDEPLSVTVSDDWGHKKEEEEHE
jgi:dCMP deaminase